MRERSEAIKRRERKERKQGNVRVKNSGVKKKPRSEDHDIWL